MHSSLARRRAVELLDEVGLAPRMHHRPAEMSGGEQQRVAVARALMNSPKLVLADEPSGNLDTESSRMLNDLIWRISREHQVTMIVVTHNMELAKRADRVIEVRDGLVHANHLQVQQLK